VKRNLNGKQSSPVLAIPKIREVRREQWTDPQFQFDEYSAVKIINDEEANGYIFFINIGNKYMINELHRAKEEEKGLIKHWFVYGIVLAGLGILAEFHRRQSTTENDSENGNGEVDLSEVGPICAGLARVVVPIIRALHKGPAALEPAASALA
jgi:hypothetical protein